LDDSVQQAKKAAVTPGIAQGEPTDHQRGTPPLALDPSRELPFVSARVFEKLSALAGDEKVYWPITFDRNRAATAGHQTGR
jgi:hypothetical protein